MPDQQKSVSLTDYLVYGVYRTFEFFLKLLPVSLVCLFGEFLGTLAHYLLKQRRKTVERNLRIAFSEQYSLEEIKKLTLKSFQQSGSNLISTFRTSTFTEEQTKQHLTVEGEKNLALAREKGTGVICLLAHMGNWELTTKLHLILPGLLPTAALYRPIDNPLIDALIKRRRQKDNTKLFSRKDGFFKPISHIKKGGSLGVLADQHAGKHGIAIPLYGKLTSMTNLPAILHRRTGACILPLSMESTERGKWKVTVHPPIHPASQKITDTAEITILCAKAYETIMSTSPMNVFWMHGYWKTGRKGPLKIDGLQKKKITLQEKLTTKPFKVIVYTDDSPADNLEIQEQLKRLKNYRPDIHLTTVGKFQLFQGVDKHLTIDPGASPHKLISFLKDYANESLLPIDCVLDFSPTGRGAPLFKKAGYSHIFTLYGKFQGKRTKEYFRKIQHPTLSDFLDSLGIKD